MLLSDRLTDRMTERKNRRQKTGQGKTRQERREERLFAIFLISFTQPLKNGRKNKKKKNRY